MIEKLAACCAALETDAYLVGGSVRDWLLSAKPGQDIDIAVSGDPEAIAREIAGRFGGTVVPLGPAHGIVRVAVDRKSTRLNSSHVVISYAVFCLKKKSKRTLS